MNEKKRITINIIATYLRSVIILFVGLLSSRWLLMALGESDYGLFGLVGGLTVYITFLNTYMSTAISRFYAFEEGERQAGIPDAEKRMTEWFNTALFIHFTLPTILLIVGYPIGIYAIQNWLTIPGERIVPCIWVFRLSCLACYAGMVSVPFSAMFIAKQKIAEYTFYTIFIPLLTIFFIYYMSIHQNEWLVRYACFSSCITIGTHLLISIRAFQVFSECRFRKDLLWSKKRLKDLMKFAGWNCFGGFGVLIKGQSLAILGNLHYGPTFNASLTIANKVSSQADFLSTGLKTAFAPAITNAYGAKEFDKMERYATVTNRVGTLLILLLALPLSLEIHKIFELWLKEPPCHSETICLFIIASLVIDKTTSGHMLAVNASGKVALYQAVLGSVAILALPLAYGFIKLGLGVMSIGYAIFISTFFGAIGRTFLTQRILNYSVSYWTKKVLLPISFVCLVSSAIGFLPHLFMEETIKRIIVTTCFSEAVLIALSWFVILEPNEKKLIQDQARVIFRKIGFE